MIVSDFGSVEIAERIHLSNALRIEMLSGGRCNQLHESRTELSPNCDRIVFGPCRPLFELFPLPHLACNFHSPENLSGHLLPVVFTGSGCFVSAYKSMIKSRCRYFWKLYSFNFRFIFCPMQSPAVPLARRLVRGIMNRIRCNLLTLSARSALSV